MDRCSSTVDGRFGGAGMWNEEARRVRLLAAELGVTLDDEALIVYDVRELMSLHLRLQRALHGSAGRSGTAWRRASPIALLKVLRKRVVRTLRVARL